MPTPPTLKTCTPMHLRWTIMNIEDIPCMRHQQFSVYNHDCYNKPARGDRAETSSTLFHHQQFSTNRPFPLARKGALFLPFNPNSAHTTPILVIPVNSRVIVNFFHPHVVFPDLIFHVKILCFHLLSVLWSLFYTCTLISLFRLWCESTVWLFIAKISNIN